MYNLRNIESDEHMSYCPYEKRANNSCCCYRELVAIKEYEEERLRRQDEKC